MRKETASLTSYVLRRLVQAVPLIFGIVIVNFCLIHLAPGDPILALVGEFQLSVEYIEEIRRQYGLDKPVIVQLLIYVLNVLKGDFGYSFSFKQPVIQVILERVPATLLLMFVTTLFSTVLGVIFGVISSRKQYSKTDNFITLVSLIGYSLPVFWLGQMLLIAFSLKLPIFPAQGMLSLRESYTGLAYWADVFHHLVLPAFALGLSYLAINTRFTRASMIEVMGQDYVRTARAKGVSERRVIYKHALRNALLPLVTLTGLNFGFLLTGAVLTETVFAWPGLGRLMYDSIYARDYPVLMGMFIFISILVIVVNLVTDIFYSVLDPRIRIQ
jgi:ABC-type dipeptide/oligopeptide/nickel transport system permease component